jgi:hypothetical protein
LTIKDPYEKFHHYVIFGVKQSKALDLVMQWGSNAGKENPVDYVKDTEKMNLWMNDLRLPAVYRAKLDF